MRDSPSFPHPKLLHLTFPSYPSLTFGKSILQAAFETSPFPFLWDVRCKWRAPLSRRRHSVKGKGIVGSPFGGSSVSPLFTSSAPPPFLLLLLRKGGGVGGSRSGRAKRRELFESSVIQKPSPIWRVWLPRFQCLSAVSFSYLAGLFRKVATLPKSNQHPSYNSLSLSLFIFSPL